ncbi:hypothetical protein F5878DRAFT_728774 [Lentinula raphanica]|uniref:Uncharacterized protein n=1 Tax=Lentinula raphanica TaxID=153919 RepID=A0AA38NZQ6_9AGAR|nr:hypothetical protein F5878DRAFT_728774 [Lentinula raphanica]
MFNAADRGNPSWLDTVLNNKSGSSSLSEAPAPNHEESAHAFQHEASPYGQRTYGGSTYGYGVSSYGQPVNEVSTYKTSPYGPPPYGVVTHGYGYPSYAPPAHDTLTHGAPTNEAPTTGRNKEPETRDTAKTKSLPHTSSLRSGPVFPSLWRLFPMIHLPSQDERGQWNDQLLKFDNNCKYGRKKIGTVTFRAGNTENPETIMKRVADAARKDQSMDYTRNNMYRRVDFSDKFFYGLKGESGVDMEPQTIEHWEFVKDKYRTMWKEEKDHRKTIDNKSHWNTREKLREKGLNSRGKPLRGAPRHAQKDSQ